MDLNSVTDLYKDLEMIEENCPYGQVNVKEDYQFIDEAQKFAMAPENSDAGDMAFSLFAYGNLPDLSKNNAFSLKRRLEGNKQYKKANWKSAHMLFTNSIACATSSSEELAFAYANRSAVLFEREFYKECLEDIERAFNTIDYPVDKKGKLVERQKKARENLHKTKVIAFHEEVPEIKNKHPTILCAADCVQISRNEKYGRFVESTRNIEPGEIICVEEPYVVAIQRDNKLLHCSLCSELCFNLISCEGCSFDLYCNEECLKKAYKEGHKWECTILKKYPTHFDNYQCWAQLSLKTTLKGLSEHKYPKDQDGSVYRSDRYKEISELVYHTDIMPPQFIMGLCISLAKIYNIIVKDTTLLRELDIKDDKIPKTMLVRDKLRGTFNCQGISSYSIKEERDIGEPTGAGAYSFFSLFNHSCVENVVYSFYGSTIIVRAKTHLPKGTQLFVNYGLPYYRTPKEVRQKTLSIRYLFTCDCVACTQNWPCTFDMSLAHQNRHFNPSIYYKLTNLYQKYLNNEPVDKKTREKVLQKLFKFAAQIRREEPSPSFGLLYCLYDKLLAVGNTDFEL